MRFNSKKQVAQLYNEVNQEIFSLGVHKQKIDIIDDKIIIFAQTKRSPLISVLSESFNELAISVDAALAIEYKRRLKSKIEDLLAIKVINIFKDYDPKTESSCTTIFLNQPIN